MGSNQSNDICLKWKKTFDDGFLQITFPNNKYSKSVIDLLQKKNYCQISSKKFDFSKIHEIFPAKVPQILGFDCRYFSQFSIFSEDFLYDVLQRMKSLPHPSIHLIAFTQNGYVSEWNDFYFKAFLNETIERHGNFKLISRNIDHKYSEILNFSLKRLVNEIKSSFHNIRDFSLATGYLHNDKCVNILKDCSQILEKSADSLENILIFYENKTISFSEYSQIFDKMYE